MHFSFLQQFGSIIRNDSISRCEWSKREIPQKNNNTSYQPPPYHFWLRSRPLSSATNSFARALAARGGPGLSCVFKFLRVAIIDMRKMGTSKVPKSHYIKSHHAKSKLQKCLSLISLMVILPARRCCPRRWISTVFLFFWLEISGFQRIILQCLQYFFCPPGVCSAQQRFSCKPVGRRRQGDLRLRRRTDADWGPRGRRGCGFFSCGGGAGDDLDEVPFCRVRHRGPPLRPVGQQFMSTSNATQTRCNNNNNSFTQTPSAPGLPWSFPGWI